MSNLIVEAPSIEEIENELLVTEGLEEAKLIPLDELEEDEQLLLMKYQNRMTLDIREQEKVKEILTRFRSALHKYDPDKAVEAVQKNEEIILSEKEFLALEDDFDDIVTIPFTYKKGNKLRRMHLDIYPLTNSQAVLDIQNNLSMFKDLTESEAEVYAKMQQDEPLTREEEIIRASVERKIEEATQQNTKQIVIEFLAMQVKFHGCDSSYEDMKKVFERIPLLYLATLFRRVQEIANLQDLEAEKVFQEFSY